MFCLSDFVKNLIFTVKNHDILQTTGGKGADTYMYLPIYY